MAAQEPKEQKNHVTPGGKLTTLAGMLKLCCINMHERIKRIKSLFKKECFLKSHVVSLLIQQQPNSPPKQYTGFEKKAQPHTPL